MYRALSLVTYDLNDQLFPHVKYWKGKGEYKLQTYSVLEESILCFTNQTTGHVSQNHRTTESQNGGGWKGPLWVI